MEQFESCNLGHVNLAAFVGDRIADSNQADVDFTGLHEAHRLMTRFLIRATFAPSEDPEAANVKARNRRIGVGHLGVASALAMGGMRYSDSPTSNFEGRLLAMARVVDNTAREFAHELRIPVPVKTRTVAPTGTIAKMPGVSEGIHPIFAKYFIRRIRFSTVDPDQVATMDEYRDKGYIVEPCLYAPETLVVSIPTKDSLVAEVEERYGDRADEIVESAADISLEDMLRFQEMYQRVWADNAVSYTVNIDPRAYTVDQLIQGITDYGPSLKGMTVFPELSRPQSPYQRLTKSDYEEYEEWQRQVADGVDDECRAGSCPVR